MLKTVKPSDMNNEDIREDIYATYRPKNLTVDRIREKRHDEKIKETEELIKALSGKIPFKPDLVSLLIELRGTILKRNPSPMLLEQIRTITYFHKYGITSDRPSAAFSKSFSLKRWKDLLVTVLGGFSVKFCYQRSLLSRCRALLNGIFTRTGKIPESTDTETISLFNAIERGEYREKGIMTWDDMMFMTFGRNYFKYKSKIKKTSIPEASKSIPLDSYQKWKKMKILSLVQWYQAALSLDDALLPEISNTFDLLFQLIPKGSNLKRPKILAEIVVFHVLKTCKRFTDWDLFVSISPLGNMRMGDRTWLLRYKQYLPSNLAHFPNPETPDLYLARFYENSEITVENKAECEKIKQVLTQKFKCINPRTIAGMVCYLSLKKSPERDCSISKALASMGIDHPGSITNAVKRLKVRREYRDNLFD
jgi:hypothetical protein